jgi:hypothetical protein
VQLLHQPLPAKVSRLQVVGPNKVQSRTGRRIQSTVITGTPASIAELISGRSSAASATEIRMPAGLFRTAL